MIHSMTKENANNDRESTRFAAHTLGLVALVIGCFIWSYWTVLVGLMKDWRTDEDYSVGQIVPLAAVYLLWQRRTDLRKLGTHVAWWGGAIIMAGIAMRLYGLIFLYESIERYSIILVLTGIVVFVGGPTLLGKIKWVIAFLCLMIPLPGVVHNMIAGPMQTVATKGAVFSLELLGSTALREGHTITLNDAAPFAVAEACSGLRMLSAFIVVGCMVAFMANRPVWQRVAVIAATVPVAIACNLIRLVATAYLFAYLDGPTAEKFFHDFAGYFMMPLAVALLLAVLWICKWLVSPESNSVIGRPTQLSHCGQ